LLSRTVIVPASAPKSLAGSIPLGRTSNSVN
jgi:hypothetical protein